MTDSEHRLIVSMIAAQDKLLRRLCEYSTAAALDAGHHAAVAMLSLALREYQSAILDASIYHPLKDPTP